ncbi:hypothetical protein MCHI_000014 [Candidatus Magnetoovum chiemensis]|nr:hypothetical protein MCHI_000014 [Candidatus Magnetoovum chiemensis]
MLKRKPSELLLFRDAPWSRNSPHRRQRQRGGRYVRKGDRLVSQRRALTIRGCKLRACR